VALASLGLQVRANESRANLNLELRLIEAAPAASTARSAPTGVARLEVTVDAFQDVHGLRLIVESPDGSLPEPGPWLSTDGRTLQPTSEGVDVPARGTIRTTLDVPLQGLSVHEIVVRAVGRNAQGPISTEAVVRAPLGSVPSEPVDDGVYANFTVQGVK
jgi:hypothetical protein